MIATTRSSQRRWLAAVLLSGLGFAWSAHAAEVRTVDVSHGDGRYRVYLDARLDAPRHAVFSVITDYENIHRLHRRIRESRVVRRPRPDVVEVFTLVRGCVAMLFCKSLRRVERITESPPGELVAEVIPAESDVKFGRVLWRLRPDGDGTILRYESQMEPDFWVPGLLGDDLLARSLLRTARDMIDTVEILARDRGVGVATEGRQ